MPAAPFSVMVVIFPHYRLQHTEARLRMPRSVQGCFLKNPNRLLIEVRTVLFF